MEYPLRLLTRDTIRDFALAAATSTVTTFASQFLRLIYVIQASSTMHNPRVHVALAHAVRFARGCARVACHLKHVLYGRILVNLSTCIRNELYDCNIQLVVVTSCFDVITTVPCMCCRKYHGDYRAKADSCIKKNM